MNKSPDSAKPFPGKLIGLILLVAVMVIVYVMFRDYLNLEYLASIETKLVEFKNDQVVLTFLIAFTIYVAVTALSLPFATVLSLTYAWFFGFVESLVLVSFASTTGATLAFLMSRYFFRDSVARMFAAKFDSINESFEKEGPFFLFTLRLIPAVPFFVVNVLMGLTRIRAKTFWWVSQIGMLPGTAVYCFLGSQFDSLNKIAEDGVSINPWLLVAFALLGVFPLLVRMVVKRVRKNSDLQKLKNM